MDGEKAVVRKVDIREEIKLFVHSVAKVTLDPL